MVRAWYMDNEETDQRLEHHRNPPKFIAIDDLFKTTGVEYFPVRNLNLFFYCIFPNFENSISS